MHVEDGDDVIGGDRVWYIFVTYNASSRAIDDTADATVMLLMLLSDFGAVTISDIPVATNTPHQHQMPHR